MGYTSGVTERSGEDGGRSACRHEAGSWNWERVEGREAWREDRVGQGLWQVGQEWRPGRAG